MKKKGIEKLKAEKEHLSEWLQRFKDANSAVPYVQRNLEIIDWEIKALENSPDEADEIPFKELVYIDRDYQYLVNSLPLIPKYDRLLFTDSTAVTISGSTSAYEYVARVGDLGTEEAFHYSQKYLSLYHGLQETQERVNAIRNMIS